MRYLDVNARGFHFKLSGLNSDIVPIFSSAFPTHKTGMWVSYLKYTYTRKLFKHSGSICGNLMIKIIIGNKMSCDENVRNIEH
jgi:hypothetical protein